MSRKETQCTGRVLWSPSDQQTGSPILNATGCVRSPTKSLPPSSTQCRVDIVANVIGAEDTLEDVVDVVSEQERIEDEGDDEGERLVGVKCQKKAEKIKQGVKLVADRMSRLEKRLEDVCEVMNRFVENQAAEPAGAEDRQDSHVLPASGLGEAAENYR